LQNFELINKIENSLLVKELDFLL
ncbi:MAG: hypothetical protein RIQ33_310, partial [Bacteroidota bacterium]